MAVLSGTNVSHGFKYDMTPGIPSILHIKRLTRYGYPQSQGLCSSWYAFLTYLFYENIFLPVLAEKNGVTKWQNSSVRKLKETQVIYIFTVS